MRLNRLRHVRCLCLFGMALSSSSLAAQQQQTTEDTTAGLLGRDRSSLNFPVKSPYGSPRSVKLLIPPTCLAGEARCEAPRLS